MTDVQKSFLTFFAILNLVPEAISTPVPYVMSWFVSMFPYFQYRYNIQNPAGISVVSLTGLGITYQMIDASVDGDSVMIFQEDGQNSIIQSRDKNDYISLSLTRGRKVFFNKNLGFKIFRIKFQK